MRTIIKSVALAPLCCASLLAAAWTNDEGPRTVAQVGVHPVNIGFLVLAEGVHGNCLNGVLYYDVSTPMGKAMYAVLVAAKSTGQKVRVGYDAPTSPAVCNLLLASLHG
jgi:hypothetical protein